MRFRRCFAHCPRGAVVYPFPPKTDVARRDLWIRQFGEKPENFKQKHLYACRRHFSSYMTYGRLLRKNAYPDVNLFPYDSENPYTQRYSYYKPGVRPDPIWHDNLDDTVAVPPKDCGDDLEYIPLEYIVPLSNELSHTEDSSSSDNDEDQQKQIATQTPNQDDEKINRKRKCILGCGGKRSLHSLPSIENELERREKWLYQLGKDPALCKKKRIYVCDLHFDIHMVGKSHLIRGAFPNKNLPPPLIKSIPEELEAQTECLQKCSDYKRKFKFPTLDRKRREEWLLKFGRSPAFYTHDIYACDRHFSDEMRVGPYLQPHAIPDQNLTLRILEEDNTSNYVIKTWSLERLQALANVTTTATTATTTTTASTVISPTDTTTAATTTTISPYFTATTTDIPPQITTQTPTIEQSAQIENILGQLKMTVTSTANQKAQSAVEYVKMQTLGVFMQHKDGYVVPMRQILNAVDPLDCSAYQLMDYVKTIEPQLNIKVYSIPKEIYEGISELSEVDTSLPPSPTYNNATVEAVDEDARIYNTKRNYYDSGYNTAKKVKFTHAYDEQQNNGDLWLHSDNYEYSNSLENAQIYNIKRNNYNPGYNTAKTVTFTQAFDEQQNNENFWRRADNFYCHKNNADVLNNFSANGVTEASAEFAVTEDPILEQLAETYPTESFSLTLGKNNRLVKYGNETGSVSKAENVIIPDEPKAAGKLLRQKITETVNKRLITVQPTQLKAATVKNAVIQEQMKPQPQQQQQHSKNSLTRAVALAESWQQVVQTMQKEVTTNGTYVTSMQKPPDAIALAARKLVEEIKQAGEREKISIDQKRIAGNLTGASLIGKPIITHIANSAQSACGLATTQVPTKIFNKEDPNAFKITSVEIINGKQPFIAVGNANLKVTPATQNDAHRAKITSVEIINSKQPMHAANGNIVTFSERSTPQILQKQTEIMQTMHRPTAAEATSTTTAFATTTTPFAIATSAAHAQPEPMSDTIEKLLSKAKQILNTKNNAAPVNNKKLMLYNTLDVDDDDLLKYSETEINFPPVTTTQHDEDNDVEPYCVLKCAYSRKLYEFPTPDAQTFQRHFWFLQLGLDIAADWRKSLYICEKHFDDTMLLPPDNTLNEYAYPCQSLMRQLNKPTTTVGTQTCHSAVEYRQKLFDQIANLQETLRQQKMEKKRVKVLIRLKQEAARLVAEIEEAKNAPKLLTIYNK